MSSFSDKRKMVERVLSTTDGIKRFRQSNEGDELVMKAKETLREAQFEAELEEAEAQRLEEELKKLAAEVGEESEDEEEAVRKAEPTVQRVEDDIDNDDEDVNYDDDDDEEQMRREEEEEERLEQERMRREEEEEERLEQERIKKEEAQEQEEARLLAQKAAVQTPAAIKEEEQQKPRQVPQSPKVAVVEATEEGTRRRSTPERDEKTTRTIGKQPKALSPDGVRSQSSSPSPSAPAPSPTSASPLPIQQQPQQASRGEAGIAMKHAALVFLVMLTAGWSVGGWPLAVLLPVLAALVSSVLGFRLRH